MELEIIRKTDAEIADLVEAELERQQSTIELIASENFTSKAVMAACGTVLTNKYAEGKPKKRFYNGCENIDKIEELAQQRACKLFGMAHANVQPHSGAQANMAVFMALLKPGDNVLGMDLSNGGHLSHGSPVNFSGMYFNVLGYGVDDNGLRTQLEILLRGIRIAHAAADAACEAVGRVHGVQVVFLSVHVGDVEHVAEAEEVTAEHLDRPAVVREREVAVLANRREVLTHLLHERTVVLEAVHGAAREQCGVELDYVVVGTVLPVGRVREDVRLVLALLLGDCLPVGEDVALAAAIQLGAAVEGRRAVPVVIEVVRRAASEVHLAVVALQVEGVAADPMYT